MNAIVVDLPLTHFRKGETLRLTVEQYAKNSGPNATSYFIGHDPQNRADLPISESDNFGTQNSILSIQVPFKIDL